LNGLDDAHERRVGDWHSSAFATLPCCTNEDVAFETLHKHDGCVDWLALRSDKTLCAVVSMRRGVADAGDVR